MAVTVNSAAETVPGRSVMPHRKLTVNLDLDDSYPTGGYPVSLAGVTNANGFAIVMADAAPSSDYRFWWDSATLKLMVFVLTTGTAAEVANEFDLSGVTGIKLNCLVA